MSRELCISDARYKLSSKDMIKNVETTDNKTIYYYNENYIQGKTVQYEIFDGVWIVYDDVVIKTSEQLFPVEETGLIEMNYCISGRYEFNFLNHKVFYMGTGDFVAALSNNECHKYNFPLSNYKGISIITNSKSLDGFLKTIFHDTDITSNLLVSKMRQYSKYKYIILLNNSIVQNIIKEIILPDNIFWKEESILKFAELVLLLINDDIEAVKVREKYFDRHLVDKVKMRKKKTSPFKRLLSFASECKCKMTSSVLLAVLGVACGMIPYFAIAEITVEIVNENYTFNELASITLIALAGYTGKVVLTAISTSLSHSAAYAILGNIRRKLTLKLSKVPLGYVLKTSSGELKTIMIDTVEKLEEPLAHIIPEMISNLLIPVCVLVYLFYLDIHIAIISLITIPIGMILYKIIMKKYVYYYKKYVAAGNVMNSTVV
ncbi:hypothetical protein J2Z42_002607 [Clostridium algifaecis]|uniref:ABC transmembrane type-1 domain-containing protein n=1 Tax=Clostridium algifaecis TaxID=1472040 RepID=A0ABS4KYE0_9CLOT|nr:ABC transporter transmembrane domain-containing protein [Clostridium algifaecis]MBP2033894.1 hypothetical protein [Clostridium algifaecis]